MHDLSVLLTFVGGLASALLLGYLAHRLKLSPIVGYLLAGVIVGPFTPGYVADTSIAEQFAEIGVILLLFGVGLRFHLEEFIAGWRLAVPGALIQSALSTGLMAVALRCLGWSWQAGLVMGLASSVASTVVMALVLAEHHDLHAPVGHIAIGWTVVEDILTVVILLVLPVLFGSNTGDKNVAAVLGWAALKLVALVVAVVFLGRYVVPRVLEGIAKSRSGELFTLAVLVIATGIAVGAAKLFGVSMALGAFLAGLVVGRSDFAARAANDALPMRDAFAVLFFVSVGMLFDPRSIFTTSIPIFLVLGVVILGKPLAASLALRLLGKPKGIAIPVGATLGQIGEFSFIVGTVARGLGLIDNAGWNALVAASILSIAINPVYYRLLRKWATKRTPDETTKMADALAVDSRRCVLVGYGPVGRIVHRLLLEQEFVVVVVDMNLATIRELKNAGHTAQYGDVLRRGTLEEAGLMSSSTFILSADLEDSPDIVRYARMLNPDLDILVRCAHLRDVHKLEQAGATTIFAGEAEVGVALAEAVHGARTENPQEGDLRRDAIRKRLYTAT